MPTTVAPHHMPGIVTVPKATVYAYWADKGVDLDAKTTAHITAWAASVPVGTMVTVFQMLTYDQPCKCLPEFYSGHLGGGCCGLYSPVPLEIVMAHLFPSDGTPCAIPGVVGVSAQGPLLGAAHGLPKYILKTA